ncbi:MAG: dihydroorotate dehydrogenase [Treponema sp.]|nr:dihydroorotate dehydrogenase [Candidatus Treponema equifaecale]
MSEIKSCSGEVLPVFAVGLVESVKEVKGAVPEGSVYDLTLTVSNCSVKKVCAPKAGQFYMLRAVKSGLLLGRPISIYHSDFNEKGDSLTVEFLILRKGKGTEELCNLEKKDEVEMIGSLGNYWPEVADGAKIAIVGGGVGVAPVAGFASTLKNKSYDFFAAFKSGSYGLENVKANKLVITTDDGSVGIKGMITAAIDAESVKNYDAVYACGPTPMLAYIQKICLEAGVQSWLSLENRMACGLGACLGCTIKTAEGNKRCCKDGPIFDGKILDFTKTYSEVTSPRKRSLDCARDDNNGNKNVISTGAGDNKNVISTGTDDSKNVISTGAEGGMEKSVDLSVKVAGVSFNNPVIAASGTFGYGSEYSTVFDVNGLGGICSKGLTLEARPGNPGQRLVETPSGLINSIGLENPGIQHFIDHELPEMLKFEATAIANLSGSTLETYVEGAKLLDKTDIPMIELNISCPNVKAGGMAWGMDCTAAGTVVKAVREVTKKPLMVKLSPNAPDLIGVAMAVKEAGADAISLVNTFQATSINIETGRPVFENIRAGFSGPAVKPIALRMVYDLCSAMNKLPESERIPVVGLGGISCWQDVVEFIMAGAQAVEVGTATFGNPYAMRDMVAGLELFMLRKGYKTLDDFRGCAL